MSYTKGPWVSEVDTTGVNHKVSIRASKENGFVQICEMNQYVDFKQDGANAKLVAAAPEMLEVIATIYNLANLQTLLETKYSKPLVNDIMTMMERTLKKARGE